MGVAAAQTLVASPSNLAFPNQPVGVTSAALTIYIYNTGTAPFVVDRVEITGDFQSTYDTCAEATLNPTNPQNGYANSYCYVYITFTPTATGSRTGTLSLIDAATGNPQVVNLMGTGITASGNLVPEPDNLTFEAQPTGTTSAGQFIYLYNTGNIPVQINSLTTTGDFAIQSNYGCNSALPTTVSPGSDCPLYVTFTPMQTSGAETGSVVVGSTAGNITIPLSGTAEAATQAIGFTPTTFNFGTVLKGTTAGYGESYGNSGEYRVIVRNTGTEAVTLSSAPTITGANAADFAFVNTQCGTQLAPGTSCSYYLDFTPSTTAAESATFSLTDSAGTQTMTLSGTGASAQPAVSLYPPTLPFDLQLVGTNSSTNYYVYFVNNGASALTVQSATITAGGSDFSVPAQYGNCVGTAVASGSYCLVYVTFGPSTAGYRTGTLTVTDQNNNTYTVALAGFAPADADSATLDPQALEFQPQPIGATSSNGEQSYQSITLTNTGNTNLTVGTLTGVDTIVGTSAAGDFSTTMGGDGCSGRPLPPGSPCNVYVSFVPTTAGSKSGSITFPVTYFDGTTGSFTANLSGQAVSEQDSATLSPTSITFPQQVAAYPNVNGVSNGFTLTLSNTGNLAFTVGTLTGTDTNVGTSAAGDFVAKNTTLFGVSVPGYDQCSGQTVAVKSSCPVYVYFAPGTTGSKTGSITFPVTYTDGTKGSFTATLSGTSIAAVNTVSISPSATQFESQIVGTTDSGNTQSITVQNTGNVPVTFTASTVSSTNFSVSTDVCGNQKTVAPDSSCNVTVQFTPQASATPGTLTGTLTINDSATGNPHTVSLSGLAIAAGQQLALSQSTVNFGSLPVSTTSNPQVVYVTNQGTSATIAIKSVLLGGTNATDFTESDTCNGSGGTTLGARSSCTVTVKFAPAASSTGSRTATVTVTPSTGAALVITLNGTGTNPIPQATVFPTSINFGSEPVTKTSTTYEYFTVTNTGSAALSVASVSSNDSPEFAISSDGCSTQSIAVNSSCTVSLTFTPGASGTRSGTITITDNSGGVANSTQTVSVSGTGTGTPLASLNQTALTFPSQTVGTTSTAMTVSLTNGGTGPLSIASIATSGNFGQTNNCGTSVAASSSCTISVTFTPQSTGSLSGSLVVTDNANGVAGSTQTVSLNGTGTGTPQATLSTTSEVFSSTPVNTTVSNPAFTLSNPGTGTLTISSIAITGTNTGDFSETNNCNGSVAAGESSPSQ